MDISDYLIKLIKTIPNAFEAKEEHEASKNDSIEDIIYNKLISRKFRTKVIPPELEQKVKMKIRLSVKEQKPLHFTVPFGGYKLWKFPTYPGPDFAELFNLIQMRLYLSRIAHYYKPGVILEYWSDEIMVSKMNNYPQVDLDVYNNTFEAMINWFNNFLPNNFQILFNKISNVISYDEYQRETDRYVKSYKASWDEVPEEQRRIRLEKAERNYKGDLSILSKLEKDDLLLDSALRHDAFIFGDWDKDNPWAFEEHMIPIGFQYTNTWGIPVKSSASSMTQFWVGMGVIKQRDSSFFLSILTYKQYLDIKNNLIFKEVEGIPKEFIQLQKIGINKE